MALVEALRKQHVDRLIEQLGPVVAKELLRLLVDKEDAAALVDDHDRVGRRLAERFEVLRVRA